MNKFEAFFDKIMPYVMKFANTRPIRALKDGFILTMPLTLVGSIFLLLSNVPINGCSEFMAKIFGEGWSIPLNQVSGATYDIIALVAVFGIAYAFVNNEGADGVSAGILGTVSMLIVTKSSMVVGNETIGGIIPKEYMGGKGVIAAIILGLMVGYIFTWFIKRDIRIKMPEGVPPGVANAFTALIPALVIITTSFLIFILFNTVFGVTFIEKVYDILQTPLQNIMNSVGAVILIPLLISLFWWCGIHGSTLISGVLGPILMANSLANQDLVNAGQTLVAGENANIFTQQFLDQFITFGGAGMTLGLVIAMAVASKSKQYKQIGKLSLIPGLFNINEPVIFGIPIIFNPLMIVPFIIVPVCSSVITYLCISTGIITPFAGVVVPWTTPPIISGLLVGGWKAALLQVLLITMAAVIYYPFFKILDKQAVKSESTSEEEVNANQAV